MSELPDFALPVIHTKACLQAILAAVENPDFDCEETLEKVRAAANEGVDRLNSILDAIAESGDSSIGAEMPHRLRLAPRDAPAGQDARRTCQ
jgi:hypothetical protein